MKALPSAAVRVMLATPFPATRNNVSSLQSRDDSPAHSRLTRSVYENQLAVRALAGFCDFVHPHTAWLGQFPSSDKRFAVASSGHPDVPFIELGYVAVFDIALDVEFLVPVDTFRADGLDVAGLAIERLGFGLLDHQAVIRADVYPPTPVTGHALTWINGRWASVSWLTEAIELGLSTSQRCIIQTDGIVPPIGIPLGSRRSPPHSTHYHSRTRWWLRPSASSYINSSLAFLCIPDASDGGYGIAFLVSAGELYEGVPVEDLYKKVIVSNWKGSLWPAHSRSIRIYDSEDWACSVYQPDPDQLRVQRWKAYLTRIGARRDIPDKEQRTLLDLRKWMAAADVVSDEESADDGYEDWSAGAASPVEQSTLCEDATDPVQPYLLEGRVSGEESKYVRDARVLLRDAAAGIVTVDSGSIESVVVSTDDAGERTTTHAIQTELVLSTNVQESPGVRISTPPRYSTLPPLERDAFSAYYAAMADVETVMVPDPYPRHREATPAGESQTSSGYTDMPELLPVSDSTTSGSDSSLSTRNAGVPRFPIREGTSSGSSSSNSSESGPAVVLQRERRPYGYSPVAGHGESREERMQRVANEERARRGDRVLRRALGEIARDGWNTVRAQFSRSPSSNGSSV
ncbi:hypothetical protein EXIGLDRAFT_771528 [Exidia glandulosa HHB12029]|uniref:Uncharacterized protein n=1 Tax=Exidia glandulosa HHB12029 TaxID=1314781 RepID=A0A165FY82_EXIGL|nr:hypothetical protein EXIGLDRAFT_771528 [Exidia glandulosa HHB12029]